MSYDEAYETSLVSFWELADFAEQRKVTMGIENVWNKYLLSLRGKKFGGQD